MVLSATCAFNLSGLFVALCVPHERLEAATKSYDGESVVAAMINSSTKHRIPDLELAGDFHRL
ncbi:MAG TPA: hypothetical protein VKV79_05235 [Terriglobia bacterium]|nr:hypothetical protein [Terriglobia bacterium]